MSQSLDIVLNQGELQNFDAKLMPQGGLRRAENVRIRRDGRFGKRYGRSVLTTGLTGTSQGLYVLNDTVNALVSGHMYQRHPTTGVFADCGYQPTWIARRAQGLLATASYSITQVASAWANGYVCTVFIAADASGAPQFASAIIQDEASGVIVRDDVLPVAAGNVPYSIRVIGLAAGALVVVWTEDVTNAVAQTTLDTSTSSLYTGWAARVAIGTHQASRYGLDACPESGGYDVIYQSGASQLTAARVNTAGTVLASANITTAADTVWPAIQHCTERIYVAWNESTAGAIKSLSYTTALASPTVAATIATAATNTGYPVLVRFDSTHASLYYNSSTPTLAVVNVSSTGGVGTIFSFGGLRHASKPFVDGGSVYIWVTSSTDADEQKTYHLVSIADGAYFDAAGYGHLMPMLTHSRDAARGDGVSNHVYASFDGYVWSSLVARGDNGTTAIKGASCFSFKRPSSQGDRWRPGVVVQGALYLAGGCVSEFDGLKMFELGAMYAPRISSLVPNVGGSMTASSDYYYVAVIEYYDALGQRHRSAPSDPVKVSLAAGQGQVSVNVVGCVISSKGRSNSTNAGQYARATIVMYRTLANGSVFYRQSAVAPGPIDTGATYAFADTTADANISSNEVLYVQGGVLPNWTPPPARLIAAGTDRVVLAGLPQTNELLISKLVVPGEPVQFADHDAFRAHIPDDVTGVHVLDGTIIALTIDAIYAIVGAGPDDTGAGQFEAPRRIPSDVGCYDARSLLEVPAGLLFQGLRGIYLLPRGGGAPQFVGQPIADRLTSYPFVTGACVLTFGDENNARFLLSDSGGTNTITAVLDLRTGQWTTDLHTPSTAIAAAVQWPGSAWVGLYDDASVGLLVETPAVPGDNGSAVTSTIELGDLRPFGVQGRGLVRSVQVLGEYRAATTITVAVSYDAGATYPDSVSWALSGLTAGAQVTREFGLSRIQIDELRIKLTDTPASANEGFVFNAVSLQIDPRRGARRFASGDRA